MTSTALIYGATGYTGRLAAAHAKRIGLSIIIAGRNASSVAELATELQAPHRVFDIPSPDDDTAESKAALVANLSGCVALLNSAGPYSRTARPLMAACMTSGVHYLDTSAEITTFALAQSLDAAARDAGVMLLPGCGGSATMLGCLAKRAIGALQTPVTSVRVALHIAGPVSRGTAASGAGPTLRVRRGVVVDEAELNEKDERQETLQADFGDGRGVVSCVPATLPDAITIPWLTGVDDVTAYVNLTGTAFAAKIEDMPIGPTDQEIEDNPFHAIALATGQDGSVQVSRLHMPNGYTFTSQAMAQALQRVVGGEWKAGFQTTAGVLGEAFVETVAGSKFV